jgi:GAF domain-containing protein
MASDSKERTALHEVVAAAGSLLDPEALAALAVGHVKAVTEADASELFWWDEAERVLTPLAYIDPHMEPPHPAMHPGQGLSGAIFADGQERVVDDYQRDLDRPLTYANRRAMAGVPLLVGGRARGVLTAVSYEPRVFGETELAPMRLMAAQLAPALMNMRLLAQAQRRTAEARALADLMLRASAEDEPDAVFALRVAVHHRPGLPVRAADAGRGTRRVAYSRSRLTSPPWSEATRSPAIVADGLLPVTVALICLIFGLTNTWSTVWSKRK